MSSEPDPQHPHGALQAGPGDILELAENIRDLYISINAIHLFLYDLPEQVYALHDERFRLLLLTVLPLSSLGGLGRGERSS